MSRRPSGPGHGRQRRHRRRDLPPLGARRTPRLRPLPIAGRLPSPRRWSRDIVAAGGSAEAIAFDVTDTEATREALEAVARATAPIQILVNNAGIHDDAAFPGMSAEQWHRVIDVSVNGFFNVTQPLLLPMIRTRWGRDRQHLLGHGADRQSRPGQLRRRQGRAQLGHQVAGARSRQPRHHRQRGRPGHHRQRHERAPLRCRRIAESCR